MNERRKKFWIRVIVGLMIAAFILPSVIVLFSRCSPAESAIKITEPERDENGGIISREEFIVLSVYGIDGEVIIDSAVNSDYKEKITAADLSKDVCKELKIPVIFSGIGSLCYLQSMNGLGEFDHGPESGWLYAVNGEYQGMGCADYMLSGGDTVEWRYTLDLGLDLGANIYE